MSPVRYVIRMSSVCHLYVILMSAISASYSSTSVTIAPCSVKFIRMALRYGHMPIYVSDYAKANGYTIKARLF